jgi:hypothetical protein
VCTSVLIDVQAGVQAIQKQLDAGFRRYDYVLRFESLNLGRAEEVESVFPLSPQFSQSEAQFSHGRRNINV